MTNPIDKTIIYMPVFNRKDITLESIKNMRAHKKTAHLHITDDASTEFDGSEIISLGDSGHVNSENLGIDEVRIKHLLHFIESDFDYCYFTDSDSLHDPLFLDRLFYMYNQTNSVCCLYNTRSENHHKSGFNIPLEGDIIIRKTIPGISMFMDKALAVRISLYFMDCLKFDKSFVKYYGAWDWMFCSALPLCALSKTSYLEHLYFDGLHSHQIDTANHLTPWLMKERLKVFKRLGKELKESEPVRPSPYSISFCLRGRGSKDWKMLTSLASIFAQKINDDKFELLALEHENIRYLGSEFLNKIRFISQFQNKVSYYDTSEVNKLIESSTKEWVCIFNENIIFCDGWYDKFCSFLKNNDKEYDVFSFPVKNVDGSRFWDWVIKTDQPQPPFNQYSLLVEPGIEAENLYLSGHFIVMKRMVWDQCKFDEAIDYHKGADSEWSDRIKKNGFKIGYCHSASVIHNDWHYLQFARSVIRVGTTEEFESLTVRPQANAVYGRSLREMKKTLTAIRDQISYFGYYDIPSLKSENLSHSIAIIEKISELEKNINLINQSLSELGTYAI